MFQFQFQFMLAFGWVLCVQFDIFRPSGHGGQVLNWGLLKLVFVVGNDPPQFISEDRPKFWNLRVQLDQQSLFIRPSDTPLFHRNQPNRTITLLGQPPIQQDRHDWIASPSLENAQPTLSLKMPTFICSLLKKEAHIRKVNVLC